MKRVLIFLVIQVVLVFVLTEVFARILDPAGISYYPETASLLDQMIIEEPIGYRLPPKMSGRFHGVHVQTNSLGLRDREIPTIKRRDEYRVLMMGDSVVFGVGVEAEDSISFQLENLLNQEAAKDRRYRTINMGVPSYNTEQELIQLRDVGLSLEPDLVLLFFIPNDIEPKMWVFEKRSNLAANLAQRSYAASLAFVVSRQMGAMFRSRDTVDAVVASGPYRMDNPSWQAVDRSLVSIRESLRASEIPLAIVSTWPLDSPHGRLLGVLADREGIPLLEVAIRRDPRWMMLAPDDLRNSRTDNHCNPKGCNAIATLLHERLNAAGLLPAPGR